MAGDTASWLTRTRAGERRALARVCRLLEEGADAELRRGLYEATPGDVWVIGVTGSPGAGKSTLVSGLVAQLRQSHAKVGVLAVDPSSPLSGGAILGDRIRMQQHFEDDAVFIRSIASRGALGGLARSCADLVRALELWGASCVVVESVGVGQDELDISALADTTCVVLAPSLGDHIQASKAGILEVADVFAVNKADLPGAAQVVSDLTSMIALGDVTRGAARSVGHGAHAAVLGADEHEGDLQGSSSQRWIPRVLETRARVGGGVGELLEALLAHRLWLGGAQGASRRAERRARAAERRLEIAILDAVREHRADAFRELAREVATGERTPDAAARRLLGDTPVD